MTKKKTIALIAGVVALFAVIAVVYILFGKKEKPAPEPIVTSEITTAAVTTAPPVTSTEPPVTTFPPFVNGLSLKAQEAKKSNSDTVGWIRLSNTAIDYPLVRTTDNDYYVDHNFYFQEDIGGWTFMDKRCEFEKYSHTDNILLYGHNMYDGTMFSNIKRYQHNEAFYEENPIIEVSSLYEDYQYKVFAFMLCNGLEGSDFEFWNYINFSHVKDNPKWSFEEYISKINDKSLIRTNVDLKDTDEYLLLSTCNSGDTTDGTRFVVLARKVRPGEDPLAGTKDSVRIG